VSFEERVPYYKLDARILSNVSSTRQLIGIDAYVDN